MAAVIGAVVLDIVDQVFNAVGGHVVPWWRRFSLNIVDVGSLWLNSTRSVGFSFGTTVFRDVTLSIAVAAGGRPISSAVGSLFGPAV
jgi:hypothetical protein